MKLAELDPSARDTVLTIARDCAVETAGEGRRGESGWHAAEDIIKQDLERLHGMTPDQELLAEAKRKYVSYVEDAAEWSEFD